MKPSSRFALTVSSLSIGILLALQPLSVSSLGLSVNSAFAKGGGGEGNGGNGGGDRGGGSEGRGGGHAADRSDGSHSQANRGKSDLAQGKSGAGQASDTRGRAESKGILEGFLADLRGEKRSHPNEKTKPATAEKAAKARESKTASLTQTTEVTASKIALGRLNAAHAFMNGKQPNGAPNSAIGQLRTYMTEVKAGNLEEAAEALIGVANKPLDIDTIETLNRMLDLDEVAEAEDVMKEVEKLQNAEPSPVPPAP